MSSGYVSLCWAGKAAHGSGLSEVNPLWGAAFHKLPAQRQLSGQLQAHKRGKVFGQRQGGLFPGMLLACSLHLVFVGVCLQRMAAFVVFLIRLRLTKETGLPKKEEFENQRASSCLLM